MNRRVSVCHSARRRFSAVCRKQPLSALIRIPHGFKTKLAFRAAKPKKGKTLPFPTCSARVIMDATACLFCAQNHKRMLFRFASASPSRTMRPCYEGSSVLWITRTPCSCRPVMVLEGVCQSVITLSSSAVEAIKLRSHPQIWYDPKRCSVPYSYP